MMNSMTRNFLVLNKMTEGNFDKGIYFMSSEYLALNT